jgi:hypothetical protein
MRLCLEKITHWLARELADLVITSKSEAKKPDGIRFCIGGRRY